MKNSVRVFAPGTVSNVGPGFDLMGFALCNPGDIMTIRKNSIKEIRIINESPVNIPENPDENVAGVAVKSLLKKLNIDQGFDLIFEEKINPGSGIGSSAASCTAAVFGVNHLLGEVLTKTELIEPALDGEFVASGSLHADNIAPAMLGGFVLIRAYNPIDLIQLKTPEKLLCTVVHPDIEIKTSESRKLIPPSIPINDAIAQSGNIAAMVSGIINEDYELIGRSLHDKIAEPARKKLIPGYIELKEKLSSSGVIGVNISGSGPSVFALSNSPEIAHSAEKIMKQSFNDLNIACKTYISGISDKGTHIISNS